MKWKTFFITSKGPLVKQIKQNLFERWESDFNIRLDLSVKNGDIEALGVEIINKKSKNILINTQCCQPAGSFNEFEAYLRIFLAKSKTTDKTCFLVGDLMWKLET